MRIYLDNSATTRPYAEVGAAMAACMRNNWGNPGGIHSFGRDAYAAMNEAREQVGALVNARAEEIYFTGGGTEADNLAIMGVAKRFERGHIITTAIEHAAVLNCCRRLQEKGFAVTYLPPDGEGRITVGQVAEALRPDTLLVSVMHANNEVGTVLPLAEIGKLLSGRGVLLHTDAVQTVGKIAVDVAALGVDMLTISGHKINGPKGVGALYVRHGVDIEPIIMGGGQERGLRSGTENMPGIVGLGQAAELTRKRWQRQAVQAKQARDCFVAELDKLLDGWVINGAWDEQDNMATRLPGNLHLSFRGVDGAALLLLLDMAGVAASAASACSSGRTEPSHVLQAMQAEDWRLRSALRLTFGWENTVAEAKRAAQIVAEQVKWLRQAEDDGAE